MWTLKIEKCVLYRFIPSGMYYNISKYIEEAMLFDFNLIVEEYGFYQQLTPRLQTDLISSVF